ncbi:MAG: hypothetical protein CMQ37_01545 [Gammaproteobacteria bacterium]|nr:hypothetical protein [Gammaproteobacteria bacterium]|tara:strand:+ start:976 stop:1959 length:984 start_codon:yes stop_codon:yes gene_type:complete
MLFETDGDSDMSTRHIYIEEFIAILRESDPHIKGLFTHGSCYRFVKLLQSLFPNVVPMISADGNHAAAELDGKLYDITGEITGEFREATVEDLVTMDSWSFDRYHMLQVGECPVCEEPITPRSPQPADTQHIATVVGDTIRYVRGFPESAIIKMFCLKDGDKLYTTPQPPAVPDSFAELVRFAYSEGQGRPINELSEFRWVDSESKRRLEAMLKAAHPAKHTRSTLPDGVTRVRNVATGEITERRAVPDGYVMVPVEPTVTTEMKIDCIGEFSWKEEAPYYDENGIVHDYVAQHVVPWDICKDIFKRMYSHLVKECQLAAAQQGGEQ